ncbi:hypothetical protein OIV83_001407 [Microbotryomycetes sp. JL201]|nr:hypothetical protein OIV83_001407 [Microbotryomycetes sp. JL201]
MTVPVRGTVLSKALVLARGSASADQSDIVPHSHTRPVPSLHFSPLLNQQASSTHQQQPDYLLISSCKDGKPQLRDWLGDWQGTFIGHKGAVWSARLSNDGSKAATGSADFTAKIWDTNNGDCIATLPHKHIVRTVDLSTNADKVLTGGAEKKLRIWHLDRLPPPTSRSSPESDATDNIDAATTAALADAIQELTGPDGATAHSKAIKSACWDEKRNTVVSMGEDKTIKFWDLRTMKLAHELYFEHAITSMERSHDGEFISVTHGKTVEFISLDTRQAFITHTLDYEPSTASLHPTNRSKFVTGSVSDGWVRVHDAETGQPKEVGKGHHGPVHCISYSPDGEMYASGSEDGVIRLWQSEPKTYGLWKYQE